MNSEKRRGLRAAPSGKASGGVVEELLGLRLQFEPSVLVLPRAIAVMPCTKSKTLSGFRLSSASTVSMILAVSAFENPRLRKNSVRSSSVRATICARAALMLFTNGAGLEFANRVSAGFASPAKREAAYFECRMVISWKSSTP